MSDSRRYYSKHCFLCGQQNEKGLQATFHSDGEKAWIEVTPDPSYQGFDGVIHGGIISAILDETLWYAVYAAGYATVTVQLELTFRRPALPGDTLRAEGRFLGKERRMLLAAGTLYNQNGVLLAEAKGRFMPVSGLAERVADQVVIEHD